VAPRRGGPRPFATGAAPAPHFPWATVIILALVVGVFWMLFRRRTYAQYPAGVAPMGGPGGPGGPGYPGAPGYPGGGYGPGGGIGSSVAGGLAGGLAAGAGIVAGEELAHHFLDGGQHPVAPPPNDDGSRNANGDMGGNDFGVNDPGSWDDSSGGGGGDFGGDGGGGGGDGWT
jgi:hypothetical protein